MPVLVLELAVDMVETGCWCETRALVGSMMLQRCCPIAQLRGGAGCWALVLVRVLVAVRVPGAALGAGRRAWWRQVAGADAGTGCWAPVLWWWRQVVPVLVHGAGAMSCGGDRCQAGAGAGAVRWLCTGWRHAGAGAGWRWW